MNETASVILHEAPEAGAQVISIPIPTKLEPEPDSTLARMLTAKRWLLRTAEKQPFYIDGTPRNGELDSEADRRRFGTWAEAVHALYGDITNAREYEVPERFAGLGFALGPDGEGGYWQGIDFDKLSEEELLELAGPMPGYVERSPSGNGLHVIGYGQHFPAFPANDSRVEAYAEKRYFTFTGDWLSNGAMTCLAEHVETRVARSHGLAAAAAANDTEVIPVDPQTVTELRSALTHMRSDDRGLWVAMGHALKELGNVGREMWLTWSATSDKHRPREDAKTWDSFKPSKTGYQAVFKAAQERGWVNPKSNAAQVATAPTTLAQRKPHNIFGRTRPQPFELDEAPRPIAELADAYSRAKGADRSGVIVAAVTAAAAMIDDRFVLRALPDWLVSARMWSFICAPSGEGKSPILRAATDPIKLLHAEALGKWRANNEFRKEQDRDPIPALYTSDATVPALSERLKDNPRGIFMLTEEFSSWIGSIEASNRGDAAKNRGDWIQLRDGGHRQVDRVGRGSVSVSNWGASVLAACTPDGLAKQLKNMPEDGLIQRFIPCMLGETDFDADGDCTAQLEMWERWMKWIYANTQCEARCVIFMDEEAASLFKSERREVLMLARALADTSPSYASHISKHSGMLAEVALIFHVLSGQPSADVTGDTMQTAIKFMRRVRQHAAHLYNEVLSTGPGLELARALARSIVAEPPTAEIARDWMTQHCAAFKKAEDRDRRQAVEMLVDLDWLEAPSDAGQYGGWPRRYLVNPQVFTLYAKDGEHWRARRAAVRAAITGNGNYAVF